MFRPRYRALREATPGDPAVAPTRIDVRNNKRKQQTK